MAKTFTFPKDKRIRKGNEYKSIFSRGKKVVGKYCRLYSHVGNDQRKMGVVISRKIKGSVKRNRHKRIIREYFRINQYKLTEHIELVIFVATCFQPACYDTIDKELTVLLKRSELMV